MKFYFLALLALAQFANAADEIHTTTLGSGDSKKFMEILRGVASPIFTDPNTLHFASDPKALDITCFHDKFGGVDGGYECRFKLNLTLSNQDVKVGASQETKNAYYAVIAKKDLVDGFKKGVSQAPFVSIEKEGDHEKVRFSCESSPPECTLVIVSKN